MSYLSNTSSDRLVSEPTHCQSL